MSDPLLFNQLAPLIEAQSRGLLTAAQIEELEHLIKTSPEARRLYVQYTAESSELQWWASHPPANRQINESQRDEIDFDLVMDYVRADLDEMSRRMLAEQQAMDKAYRPYRPPAAESEERQYRTISIPTSVFYGGIAAAIALVATLVFVVASPAPSADTHVADLDPNAAPTPARRVSPVVGIEVASAGAVWMVDSQPYDSLGEFRTDEQITLLSGMAELRFEGGASIIVNAPATLIPVSHKGLRLIEGNLVSRGNSADTPFSVQAGETLVENLGHEFAVRRDSGMRQVEAHAFDGPVRVAHLVARGEGLSPRVGEEHTVSGGRALRMSDAGRIRELRADGVAFVRADEFECNLRAAAGSAYDRWLAYSYQLRRDPALVAYYTFDNREEARDRLINRAGATQGEFDGLLGIDGQSITAPQWTEGRFPQKQALRFGVVGQELARAVQVDGLGGRRFGEDLTLAVWVKTPPSNDRTGGGTLLSFRDSPIRHMSFQFSLFLQDDAHSNRLQFGAGNELQVSNVGENFVYSDPRSFPGEQWTFVAVVYRSGSATFFVNGSPAGTSTDVSTLAETRPDTPLLIGMDAYIHNVNGRRQIEAFMGLIDEVVILDRSMSPDEINSMYQVGRPDRP